MLTIIIAASLFLSTHAYSNNCCFGENIIRGNGTCFDGSELKINSSCPQRIIYAENEFALSINGSLIELGGIPEFVPEDRFCLGAFETTGRNISVVCSTETDDNEKFYTRRVICALLSVLFLVLTITVYIILPKLRDLQGKCILSFMGALAVAFISLSTVQLNQFERGPCLFWAFTVYFTFLVTFFWLNIVAINVWRKTVFPTSFNKTDSSWFMLYCVYGYGGPGILLLSTIIAHNVEGNHIKPGFGEGVCFFNGPLPLWSYFYGPAAVLLIINLILFTWTSVILWFDFSEITPRTKGLKYKSFLTIKLCLIMGVPWLFEVVSFPLENVHRYLDYLWSVTDCLNALQGVLIFMVLVLFRKKALRGLANHPKIGYTLPRSWQRLDDTEYSSDAEEALSESK